MSLIALNLGQYLNDPSADSVRQTFLNVAANFATLDRRALVTSILDPTYGTPTDGISDCAAAINAAIAAINAAGGGVVAIPNSGFRYMLSTSLVPLSNVSIVGLGKPLLQVMPGANCAAIQTQNFATYAGTNSNAGPVNVVIDNLVIDGNASTQTAGSAPDTQNGVNIFAPGAQLRNLKIQNCYGHGMRVDWGQGAPATVNGEIGVVEGLISNIHIAYVGRHGFWFRGSHDTNISDIIVENAGTQADNTYYHFNMVSGGAARCRNLHGYNYPLTGNMPAYSLYTEGYIEFINSHFESAHQSVWINGPQALFSMCRFYMTSPLSNNLAIVDVQANQTTFIGCYFGGTTGQATFALSIGKIGTPVSGVIVQGGQFSNFDSVGPFNFVNDGGHNVIQGVGLTANGSGTKSFTGTIGNTSRVDYLQYFPNIDFRTPAVAGDNTGLVGNAITMAGSATGAPLTITAAGVDANISICMAPKGLGALVGDVPDGTAAGGNTRGYNTVDFQTQRAAATQVASGAGAALVGGANNTASGNYSSIVAGFGNTANGGYDFAGGRYAFTNARQAALVYASGEFANPGDGQKGLSHQLRAITTTATPVVATTDLAAIGGYNNLQLQLNSATIVRVRAVARNTASGACVHLSAPDFLVTVGATLASIAISGGNVTMTVAHSVGTVTGWGLVISADTTYGGLICTCTGAASTTIHWVVDPEWLEVI